jgi:AcrR family transcriptional regulator
MQAHDVGNEAGTSPARPLRRDAERNRLRILAAAAQVFTERGLEATLDDVAHHAGVGVGTVYRRFGDKEALAEALFEERLDALVAIAEGALGEQDSWTGLVSFFEQIAALLAGDRGLHEVLMSAAFGGERVACARERLRPVVRTLIERAQADGHVRADLRSTDWPLIAFMLNAAAEYTRFVRPDLWRRYLVLILDGLRPDRGSVTPLPEPALTAQEIAETMRSWPSRRH